MGPSFYFVLQLLRIVMMMVMVFIMMIMMMSKRWMGGAIFGKLAILKVRHKFAKELQTI